jgi:hypothetical protein
MGYRHIPLSRRWGLAFDASRPHWRVDMPEAECFMYFVAAMTALFGRGHTLYVEGRDLAPDVQALYQSLAAPRPWPQVAPVLRHPAAVRLQVCMDDLGRPMKRLAACRTFREMGEVMLVHKDGEVLLDGTRLSERSIRLSGRLDAKALRRFAGGALRGTVQWVET